MVKFRLMDSIILIIAFRMTFLMMRLGTILISIIDTLGREFVLLYELKKHNCADGAMMND